MTQPHPVDVTSPRSFVLTGRLKTQILHLPYFYFGIWFYIAARLVWRTDWLIELLFDAWFSLWFSTGPRISGLPPGWFHKLTWLTFSQTGSCLLFFFFTSSEEITLILHSASQKGFDKIFRKFQMPFPVCLSSSSLSYDFLSAGGGFANIQMGAR